MTVPSQQSSVRYATDGTTTDFPVPFYFILNSDLVVTVGDDESSETLTLGSDYSVSGAGQQSGGTVTLIQQPEAGLSLFIEREPPFTQETAYQRNDAFPERAHERALDKLTMLTQWLRLVFSRSIRFPVEFPLRNPVLPRASLRARKAVIFDENGNVTVSSDDYEEQAADAAASAAAAAASATQAGAARDEAREIADDFGDLDAARGEWEAAVLASAAFATSAELDADRAEVAADASEAFSGAKLYFTLAGLQADTSPAGTLGVVMSGPDMGYYLTNGTTWTKTDLQPLTPEDVAVVQGAFGLAWSKESNWRAPVYEFGDVPSNSIVDQAGNIIDGPEAISVIAKSLSGAAVSMDQIRAALGGRAPVYEFGEEGEDYVTDVSGNVIGGLMVTKYILDNRGGGGGSVSAEPAEPVYIEGGVLKALGAGGDVTILDPSPYSFQSGAHWRGKAAITAINRPSVAGITPVAVVSVPDWATVLTLPSGSTLLIIIMAIGQSNSVGAQGFVPPAILTQNNWPDTLLMPSGPGFMDVRFGLPSGQEDPGSETVLNPDSITGFKPLISMQSQLVSGLGATPLEGMAYTLANMVRQRADLDVRVCVFTSGWGGRFYTGLEKGTIPYNNGLTGLQKLKELADARGWHTWMPFVAVHHGESDSTRPEYISQYVTWQADYQPDIQGITGQSSAVPFIATQAGTFFGSSTPGVLAHYQAAKADPSKFYLASPYYQFEMAPDNLHLGQRAPLLGEKVAHCAARVLGVFGSEQYGTVMPLNVSYDGANTIDVQFYVPVPPLVRDTVHPIVNNPAPADWGFRIRDGSGAAVAISSIAIIGGTTVRIVTAAPPSAGSFRSVDYALVGYPASPRVAGLQPRGQLRDSDTITSYVTGERLPNWCPHFRESF